MKSIFAKTSVGFGTFLTQSKYKFHVRNFASALVIAEHDNTKIISNTYNVLTAANQLKVSEVNVLLAGHFEGNNAQNLAKQLSKMEGVTRVLIANKDIYKHSLAENIAPLVKNVQGHYKNDYVLAPSSSFGKNFLPRIAGMLGISAVSDIVQVKAPDTFVRPIYAGNALSTIKTSEAIKLITVRTTAFDKAKEKGTESEIATVPDNLHPQAFQGTQWVSDELKVSSRPDLQNARIVVSGGRALKSAENFKIIEALADQFGAAVGASRAAVDSGYASNDMQVGQTGKIIAPELYIGIGISGAIQHLAGMKDSKIIAVINKDAEAPFFQVADYGLVADLFNAVPEMTEYVKKVKAQA